MNVSDLPARIAAKIVIDENGCWIWTGASADGGYGSLWFGGRTRRVHRVVYELLVGPIPEGLDLDHVRARGCQSRACANPAHLEPVTEQENTLRGDSIPARNAAKTHCDRGHLLDETNTYVKRDGRRNCRACERSRSRRRRAIAAPC